MTRISDLAEKPFDVAPLGREHWATGDYVVGEVSGSLSAGHEVELPTGRLARTIEGDLVVGALGKRMATLEGVGDWEAIGEDGALHALTSAGLFGKVTSASPLGPAYTDLTYCGHVMRGGDKVAMGDFVEARQAAPFTIPTVLLIGTSMSAGKTSSGRTIVHELTQAGLKVAAAKLTGAARYRDVLSFGDAGAAPIYDFIDIGLPSTVCPEAEFREKLPWLLARVADAQPDIFVAEAGASPLEPYNGAIAVEMLDEAIAMLVLSASDPYAVFGVQKAFAREPDVVCGPAANTDAGVALVGKLCGVPALNLLTRASLPALRELMAASLPPFKEAQG